MNQADRHRAMLNLCKAVGNANLIGTDLDNVQVTQVINQDFPQQSNGTGLHLSFSISWHAIGKLGREGHDALDAFEPANGWDDNK